MKGVLLHFEGTFSTIAEFKGNLKGHKPPGPHNSHVSECNLKIITIIGHTLD